MNTDTNASTTEPIKLGRRADIAALLTSVHVVADALSNAPYQHRHKFVQRVFQCRHVKGFDAELQIYARIMPGLGGAPEIVTYGAEFRIPDDVKLRNESGARRVSFERSDVLEFCSVLRDQSRKFGYKGNY